jgi:hypothetical protein
MNHRKVYDRIVENRLNNPLSKDEYGEKHHILPQSLGGSNKKENIVRLTAREHFICHALLAEMYEYGSVEWIKMNLAFKMMKVESPEHNGNRYINSRLYELKKEDFSKVMSCVQSGNKNSQHGKVWIYNLELKQNTIVESSDLSKYTNDGWVLGRKLNWDSSVKDSWDVYIGKKKVQSKQMAEQLWEKFKSTDCSSLNEFSKICRKSQPQLTKLFKKFIPEYTMYKQRISIKRQI